MFSLEQKGDRDVLGKGSSVPLSLNYPIIVISGTQGALSLIKDKDKDKSQKTKDKDKDVSLNYPIIVISGTRGALSLIRGKDITILIQFRFSHLPFWCLLHNIYLPKIAVVRSQQ